MTTEYKGFTIHQRDRFYVTQSGRTLIVLNQGGYPTMNHAKGAITRHLKAQIVQPNGDPNKAPVDVLVVKAKAADDPKAEYASVLVAAKPVTQSRNKREGRYAGTVEGKHLRTTAVNRINVPCAYRANRAAVTKALAKVGF